MTDLKPVFIYKPARTEKKKGGNIVPDEYVGVFRTKVAPNTPGAIHHSGKNAAGKSWDFWGVDVDSINGVLRWIDCREGEYGATIELFLETPKSLRQITIPFTVQNLHDVMNHLCGLKKEIEVAMLNVSHWVRVKKNPAGVVKTGKDDKPIWAKSITFRDVTPEFSFEAWREFAAKNGLEWVQEKKIGGTEWNFQAELAYWIGRVVKLQRFLLSTENVLPFCWNSMTATKSDGTALTLTDEEIASLQAIYDGVKPLYKFPFGRTETTADYFESGDYSASAYTTPQPSDGWPTEPQVSGTITADGDESLPF